MAGYRLLLIVFYRSAQEDFHFRTAEGRYLFVHYPSLLEVLRPMRCRVRLHNAIFNSMAENSAQVRDNDTDCCAGKLLLYQIRSEFFHHRAGDFIEWFISKSRESVFLETL